jgi:hypothetical protein
MPGGSGALLRVATRCPRASSGSARPGATADTPTEPGAYGHRVQQALGDNDSITGLL